MSLDNLQILVVDDEEAMRTVLESRLTTWGLAVRTAADLAAAERQLAESPVEAIVSDVMLPDGSGVDLLDRLAERGLTTPVVLITAHGTVDLAVEAMKRGALDFITKPIDYERLRRALEAAQAELRSRRRTAALESEAPTAKLGELIGSSRPMRELFAVISEIAPTNASVLLTGESGTGKELAARTIHRLSRRRHESFIPINSAAIPHDLMESEIFGHERGAFTGAVSRRRGCFELAHLGTLFFDEIAEMPIELQPKLLRVLEDGRVRRLGAVREIGVDVRLIAATNRPPAQALAGGQLREDLYYRLNVFELELPPLRDRREDIPLLVERFVRQFNRDHDAAITAVSAEALEHLQAHPWPGNVRELRNVIERAVVLGKQDVIEPDHLPASITGDSAPPRDSLRIPAGTTIAKAERALILQTLEETANNKAEAARRLQIDVKTIRNKLKSWGIKR